MRNEALNILQETVIIGNEKSKIVKHNNNYYYIY